MGKLMWAAALAIFACEMGLRVVGFGRPLLYEPSSSGYELKPHQAVSILGKQMHVNYFGMRGPEVTATPPPRTIRILCLGDSVINGGIQIDDGQTVPMLLQEALSLRDRPAEVLNASAGGWAPGNEAAWLGEHGTFHAADIVLEINEKDLDQPFATGATLTDNPSFPAAAPLSALAAVTRRYVLPQFGFGHAADPGSTAATFKSENTAQVLTAIKAIHQTALKNYSRLAILYWDIARPTHDPAVERARDQLFRLAFANHISVIRPDLNLRPDAAKFYRDAVHPNARANAFIAEALKRYFLTRPPTHYV